MGSGVAIISVILFLIFFGYAVVPYDSNAFVAEPLLPPCSAHLMGTDSLGRDVFSRTIIGSRMSMAIAFLAILLATVAGSGLGAMSGYLGGVIDRALAFLMDSIWIFPTIVMAMILVLVLGRNPVNTSVAIAFMLTPRFYRVIRSHTLVIKERGFVEAQKMIGANWVHIIVHHILPFYISSIAVLASLGMAEAALSVSGLGFLGLGVSPPTPEWGTDLASGQTFILSGRWWLSFYPGFMIFISILGFNLLSESLDRAFKSSRASYI